MKPDDSLGEALREWIEVFNCRAMRSFIRNSKDRGLSMPQLGALFYIRREGRSGVTDLGDDLGITSAAASQMLERLVQQGLILRVEDPADRRVKQLALTEKGSQAIQESLHTRQEWLNDLAATLSPSEKVQVTAALKILVDRAARMEDPGEALDAPTR